MLCSVLAGTVALTGLPATQADAAVRQPFNAVFSEDDNGAIAIVGNSNMSCSTTSPVDGNTCTAARAMTASAANNNNNNQNMAFVNVDSSGGTTNSSSAILTIPSGSTVRYARLVWSGRQTAGTNGVVASGNLNQVKFRGPGDTAYQTLTGAVIDPNLTGTDGRVYQGSLDVTSLVAARGSGSYTVGDIKAATGQDRYAGWSLVVAYRNPALPLRNLTIFEGFADVTSVSGNNAVTIPVSGFRTPLSGTVNAQVGFVAWEGDAGLTGDYLQFNGTTLTDAARPADNYFNSKITTLGQPNTDRNPNFLNNFGVDMGTANANGLLSNGQTSTTLVAGSNQEYYYPGVITTQIDLFSPKFPEVTKSVVNLNGNSPARPGDLLEYTLSYPNSGGDAANNVIMTDTIAPNTTYVPNSMLVTAGANASTTPKTDATGDDVAEYTAANRQVTMRLGTGASATTGGTLAPNASTTVKFRVSVDRAAAGTTVDNVANLAYTAATLGNRYNFVGNVVSTPVSTLADLAIVKTSNPTSQNAGAQVRYDLTATNNGPNAATAVVVTDTLPSGATFVQANPPTGITCGQSSGTVTCQVGTLANGASVTIPITVSVAPGTAAGTLVNRATVSSATADDVAGNNSATASTQVTRSADVAATVTGPATARAGDQVTWTATVTNNGPSTATAVTLNDLLPSAATFISAQAPAGATCTNANNQVNCTFGDLAPGEVRTVTVIGQFSSAAPAGPVVNTVTAATSTPDPVPANNTAQVTTTLSQLADIAVTKAPLASPVNAGARARFTITVSNTGPSDATNVVITDPAVAGYTVVSANGSQGTCTVGGNGTVTCQLGRVAAGGSATIQIIGDVAANRAAGPLTNTANGTTETPQSNTANDSGSGTVQVATSADVFLTKTASPNPIQAGQQITYTLVAGNNGPSVATGVSIVDTLPENVTFVSSADGCTAQGRTVTCAVGTLANGATASRTFVASLPANLPPGVVTNTATVSSNTPDPTPGNNNASYNSTTGASADLQMTKTTSPSPLVAGGPVTYTVRVVNAGPSDAQGVVVTDTVPDSISTTGLTATASNGSTCTVSGRDVRCPIGSITNANAVTVTIRGTVLPSALGASSNTAQVSAATPDDPTLSNNTATSTSNVVTSADLGVVLTAQTPTVRAGENARFQLVVTNDGPSQARNSVVTGQVPDGLVPVLGSTGGACTVSGQTVRCALGTLDPGARVVIPLEAQVRSSTPAGTVTSTAGVGTSSVDPNPANDVSSASLAVITEADLQLAKDVSPRPIVAGSPATYTLTARNAGPSDAVNVVIRDTLPAGMTIRAASPSAGICNIAGQTVTCTVDRLAADTTDVITIETQVAPTVTGQLSNQATIASDTTDPTPGNNSASVTAPVAQRADLRMIKAVDPSTVRAGSSTQYTLTVVNAGPSVASDLVVSDPMPAGLTILPGGITASAGTCAASSDTAVNCSLPQLAVGASWTITVNARVASAVADGTTLTNTATVASPTTDVDARTRTATVTSTVRAEADLSLIKDVTINPPTAGETERYTLTVTNNGPSDATNVVITDDLPDGVTVTGTTPARFTCSQSGRTLTCGAGTLTPGDLVTLNLDVRLAASLSGQTITNVARVDSATRDPNTDNNTARRAVQVVGRSDLVPSKTVTSGPVVAGGQVTYQVSVRNAGPSDTTDVVLSDTLPTGLTPISAQAAGGGDCATNAQTVRCRWASLAVGADPLTATVTAQVAADLTPGTSITNTATATSSNPDPDPTPGSVTSTVQGSADVSVTKSLLEAPVAGQPARWRVTVSNAGPSVATGVTLTDNAAAGVTFTGAETPRGTCTTSPSQIGCALGTLGVRDSFSVTVIGDLAADYSQSTVRNTAVVASDVSDPNTDNNSATVDSDVTTMADLDLVKVADPAQPTAGGQLTYRVTVTNNGPSTARTVRITDRLPDGFTATSVTLPQGQCADGPTCTLATLANGAQATMTIVGTVSSDFQAAQVTNVATVTSNTEDPDRSNNTARVASDVQTNADLRVTAAGPATITAGAPITWTVTVDNAGPSRARAVVLTDTVPDGVGQIRARIGGQDCAIDGRTIRCELGAVAAGGQTQITITGVVDPGFTGTTLTNTATVSSATPDPVAGNNTDSSDTAVTASADLSVTKTADTSTFTAGQRAAWTIVVANGGPSVARAAELSDSLPAGFSDARATTTAGTCTIDGSDVRCALGDIAPGSVVVKVSAQLDQGSTDTQIVNRATVTSPTPDPTPGDRTGTSTTDVVTSADLVIGKRIVGQPVAGAPIQFEITVTNAGPSAAAGVVVSDILPDEARATSATLAGGSCTIAGQQVTCVLDGPLADGATALVTIGAVISPDYAGALTNTATVTADTPDPETAVSNTTTVTGGVDEVANLSATKTGPATIAAGEQISWTVTVANSGPSRANAVQIRDVIPATVTGASGTFGDAGTCTLSEQTLQCDVGDIEPGSELDVTITGTVASSMAPGRLVNRAVVSSGTADPDTTDNTGTSITEVVSRADVSLAKQAIEDSLTAGGTGSFVITASNAGPSDAQTVQIVDALPAGLTVAGDPAVSRGTCQVNQQVVSCAVPSIAARGSENVRIPVRLASNYTGASVGNTATVTTANAAPDTDGRSASVTVPVVRGADLTLSKSGPATALAGRPLAWRLQLANSGPSSAEDVVITDTLPAGIAAVTADASQGQCTQDGATVTCVIGSVAAQGSVTVDLTLTNGLPADFPTGPITNNAQVTSSTPEPGDDGTPGGGRTASSTTEVQASADVSVSKVPTSPSVTAGGEVSWTIIVANNGPSVARDVVVTDTPGAGITGLTLTGPNGVTCDGASCQIGDLGVGRDRAIQITATGRVPADSRATTISNTARVTSTTPDPDPGNGTVTSSVPVTTSADLAVTKTADVDQATPGERITWTITVSNNGPSAARNVVLADDLPSGVSDVQLDLPPGVTCTGALDCALGDVAAGQAGAVAIKVSARVDAAFNDDSLRNVAQVSADTADPEAANNTAESVTPVQARADLVVTKTGPQSATPGGSITWAITVDNNGPSVARDVVLTDAVPAGVSGVQVSPEGTCQTAPGVGAETVRCAVGDLAPGDDPYEITLTGMIDPGALGTITNTAIAASPSDPDGASAQATTTLTPQADLAVVKTVTPDRPTAGAAATFTLTVTNAGPSVARAVTVIDQVDPALSVTAVNTPQGTCDPVTGGLVTCSLGDVTAGSDPIPVTITVDVPDDYAADTFTNTGRVVSQTDDPDLTNNSSTIGGDVDGQARLTITKTARDARVPAEGDIVWTIVVANGGPATARNVSVVDTLPQGLTAVAIAGDDATCTDVPQAGGPVSCQLGDLPTGQTRTLTVTAKAAPSAEGSTVVNTAVVASSTPGPDPQEAFARSTVGVGGRPADAADLSIRKELLGRAFAGAPATWRVTVSNAGPSAARAVTVTDVLPVGARFIGGQGCAAQGGAVTCTVDEIASGSQASFTIVAALSPDLTGTLTNQASVTAATPDPNGDNNQTTVTSPVSRQADLAVTKTADRSAVTSGDTVTWTIRVTNDGPSSAMGVVVTDAWPSGAALIDFTPAQGSYDPASGRWTVGTLPQGGSTQLVLTARLTGPGEVRNVATASSDTPDPENGNDAGVSVVQVSAPGIQPPAPRPPGMPMLPNTGGPAAMVLVLGLLGLLVGGVLTVVGRRKA